MTVASLFVGRVLGPVEHIDLIVAVGVPGVDRRVDVAELDRMRGIAEIGPGRADDERAGIAVAQRLLVNVT